MYLYITLRGRNTGIPFTGIPVYLTILQYRKTGIASAINTEHTVPVLWCKNGPTVRHDTCEIHLHCLFIALGESLGQLQSADE